MQNAKKLVGGQKRVRTKYLSTLHVCVRVSPVSDVLSHLFEFFSRKRIEE